MVQVTGQLLRRRWLLASLKAHPARAHVDTVNRNLGIVGHETSLLWPMHGRMPSWQLFDDVPLRI